MKLKDLINRPSNWLLDEKPHSIVVTSRIRLARNVRGIAFPDWASDEDLKLFWDSLIPLWHALSTVKDCLCVEMKDLNELDRQILFERFLISHDHMKKGEGSGLVVSLDEGLSIMVNEEDHFRIQAIGSGFCLDEVWKQADKLDDEIDDLLPVAFSSRLGYLTACPSNMGTGMRASCMVHLPGLVLTKDIKSIVRGLNKMGLVVRGLGGEGSESAGNMFQISNQITLGISEKAIIKKLNNVVSEIVFHEKNARLRLMEDNEALVRDHVGRAYGILSNAHVLSSKETLDWLSGLRLGIDLGLINHVDVRKVDELLMTIRPGHLQKRYGKQLNATERDIARAEMVRAEMLKHEKEMVDE